MVVRNLEIDRLRALSILLITYAHYGRIFYPWIISQKEHYLTTIVDLFFVISGYVISTVVIQKIDQLKSDASSVAVFIKSFYLRRICRVYPAAWLVFFCVLFISITFNSNHLFSTPTKTLEAGVYLFTYTFNYFFLDNYHNLALAPYWTLMIEEQFYFFFPLFILFTRNDKQRFIILLSLLLIITFIVRPLSLYYFPREIFYTHNRCDGFIYGFLIYYLTRQPWMQVFKLASTGNMLYRALMVLIILFMLTAMTGLAMPVSVIISLGAILSFILVCLASFQANVIIFPYFIQKCLDIIGMRSYSLYLIHLPMMLFAKELWDCLHQQGLQLPVDDSIVALCLIALGTEILYRTVEKPTLKLGKRVSKKVIESYQMTQKEIEIENIAYAKE